MLNRYFEEYAVGDRWVSRGRTITEADIVNFAGISGDWYPLHIDEEYARKTQFGRRIAHGMLVLAMGTGLAQMEPGRVVAFYGMDRVRFTAPTFIGDTIHVDLEVLALEEKGPNQGVVTFRNQISNQRGEQAVVSEIRVLMRKREG